MERLTKFVTEVGACVTSLNSLEHYMPCVPCRHRAALKVDADGTEYTEKFSFCDTCEVKMLFNRLAHYEDLEEQGRLVVLPCKIDAPIYLIHQETKPPRKPRTFRVNEYHIDHFTIGGAMIPMITACSGDNEWEELIDGTQCGQEYFLTREEAEAALEKGAEG